MNVAGKLGTLQKGAWADLVVLDSNPATDIKNMRSINSVWIAGKKILVGQPILAAAAFQAALGPANPQPRQARLYSTPYPLAPSRAARYREDDSPARAG